MGRNRSKLVDAVCQRTLAALPDMRAAHAVERDVDSLIHALTNVLENAFPDGGHG